MALAQVRDERRFAVETRALPALARARARLAPTDDAEAHSAAAVHEPAAARWPFDHALARLDHAEWLRWQRRVSRPPRTS
ncbi:hypothetical protein [Frankia sp. R82]|uniref:hypothetical protein n=1 Tax=Frankia sp. R82 TaxID=2950553 RepID=UPI00204437F3|nr:hypothetical protein [Frankia sp. R82]MCM3882167.1 hypothetical protein [Frankia sp. R82]